MIIERNDNNNNNNHNVYSTVITEIKFEKHPPTLKKFAKKMKESDWKMS